MAFIYMLAALIVLGILYSRMNRRETPQPVSKMQAILPVVFGMISVLLSFFLFLGIGNALLNAGYSGDRFPLLIRSVLSAFFAAGLPEELTKLVMILLTILIFRSRIRNVYEYILAGAAVGLGFTLFEEFCYGSGSLIELIIRFLTVAAHMVFGIIMAKHLGIARYNKTPGQGSAAAEYAKAFLIPVVLHTVYDASNAGNKLLTADDDMTSMIGIVISLAALIIMFILQILVLKRLKKDTDMYCGMTF